MKKKLNYVWATNTTQPTFHWESDSTNKRLFKGWNKIKIGGDKSNPTKG